MFLRRFKSEGILEVIHNLIDGSLESPRKDIVIGLRLLDALKVTIKKIFWSRCIPNGKGFSSY